MIFIAFFFPTFLFLEIWAKLQNQLSRKLNLLNDICLSLGLLQGLMIFSSLTSAFKLSYIISHIFTRGQLLFLYCCQKEAFFDLVQNQIFNLLSFCTLRMLSSGIFEMQTCNTKSFVNLMTPTCLKSLKTTGSSNS